jgi:hypothetical protein
MGSSLAVLSRRQRPIVPAPRNGELPLSFDQEGRLLLESLDRTRVGRRGRVSTVVVKALRIRGGINAARLQQALDALVRRHEALRSGVLGRPRGEAGQRPAAGTLDVFGALGHRLFVDSEASVQLVRREVLTGDEAVLESRMREIVREMVGQPFDYARPPLLRPTLVTIAPTDALLVVVADHLVCDGWSLNVLLDDLQALYRAGSEGPALPPGSPIGAIDVAHWERSGGDEFWRDGVEFWARQWREFGGALVRWQELPFAKTPSSTDDHATLRESIALAPSLVSRIHASARRMRVTPYMLTLAALHLVLQAYAGRSQIAVTVQLANRTRPELERVVGWLSHAHIIGVACDRRRAASVLVDALRRSLFGALAHQDVSPALVWATLARGNVAGSLRAAPVSDLNLSLEATTPEELAWEPLTATPVHVARPAVAATLRLLVEQRLTGLSLTCHFSPHLLHASGVAQMLRHLSTMLDRLATAPDTPVTSLLAAV